MLVANIQSRYWRILSNYYLGRYVTRMVIQRITLTLQVSIYWAGVIYRGYMRQL